MPALGLVALAVAVPADQLLLDALRLYGTYGGEWWTQDRVIVADRLPKLLLLGLLGPAAVFAVRSRASWSASAPLLVIGVIAGILPSLVMMLRLHPPMLVTAVWPPAQFVTWTGSGLLLIGLAALIGLPASRRQFASEPMIRLAVMGGVLPLAFVLDGLVAELMVALALGGDSLPALSALELAGRFGVLASLFGLAWVIASGPRSRVVGALALIVGVVVLLGPALGVILARPDFNIELPGMAALSSATYLGRWLAAGVLLLGLWELAGRRAPQNITHS